MSRESVYDEKIFPLMGEIIAICKENEIPMAAFFELDRTEGEEDDDPLFCSTIMDEHAFTDRLTKAGAVVLHGRQLIPTSMSMIIRGE